MAIRPSTMEGRVLSFRSKAAPRPTILVSFDGTEAISRPFRFELELACRKADVDPAEMMKVPASIVVKRPRKSGSGSAPVFEAHIWHGMLASFEQHGQGAGMTLYHAEFVPRLWALSEIVQTRVFLGKTVPEIVEEVLKEAGLAKGDCDFQVDADATKHPRREYVVQYGESDLDFISRWLEHEGISYCIDHEQEEDGKDKVVFVEATSKFPAAADDAPVRYSRDLAGEAGWLDAEAVHELVGRSRRAPKEVVLADYNYRKPSVGLKASKPVDAAGVGRRYWYGDHYKTPDEGKHLAKVRAEELECRSQLFTGAGNCRVFRAGRTYTLTDHYRSDFNQEYLLVEVQHHAQQGYEAASAAAPDASYRNEFLSIPKKVGGKDVAFRPERLTPKPRVDGTLNARVDASGDGKYAEIDGEGRYKVQLPFDLSGADGGKASHYVRMAQPYAGAGMGMHFPLHKGTEVVLAHTNGDPDRPIIVASVPNPETGSPVTGGNQSQCVIHTGGNNKIVIEDQEGNERIKMTTPHENTWLQLGSPNQKCDGFGWGTDKDSLSFTGGDHKEECVGFFDKHVKGEVRVCYDANAARTVAKNDRLTVKGDSFWTHEGDKKDRVLGNKDEWVRRKKSETVLGGKEVLIVPNKVEVVGVNSIGMVLGNKSDVTVGSKIEVTRALTIKTHKGRTINLDNADELKKNLTNLREKVGALWDTRAGRALIDCKTWMKLKTATVMEWTADKLNEKAKSMKLVSDSHEIVSDMMKSVSKKLEAKSKKMRFEAVEAEWNATINANSGNLKVKK